MATCSTCSTHEANQYSRFNSALAAKRRQNLNGVYDPHTNVMQYPKIMQPTHARWELVPAELSNLDPSCTNRSGANEVPSSDKASQLSGENRGNQQISNHGFSSVTPILKRNFMITDIYYQNPPRPGLGVPGSDGAITDIGAPGLSNVAEKVLAELPDDCRQAFDLAKEEEMEWMRQWDSESTDTARAQLKITYSQYNQ